VERRVEAEADRVLSRKRWSSWPTSWRQRRHRHRDRHEPYGAQLIVEAAAARGDRKASQEFTRAAARAGLPAPRWCGPRLSARTRTNSLDPARITGSYPFEGPRLLAGWTAPPATAAVYVIAYKPAPEAKPDRYAVIYVDHSADLSAERFPSSTHERTAGSSGGIQVQGLHLHLRDPRRRSGPPGADRQGTHRRSTGRAATTSSTTRPGRMSGSAVPRRSPLG